MDNGTIVEVDESTLLDAARIHSESWKESHKAFCSTEFINRHTVMHQKSYLSDEMNSGKRLYMLLHEKPVGIVSVKENLIENLYVLPKEQKKGYGSELLRFAIEKCIGVPRLWILDNNQKAYSLYIKNGFTQTGQKHRLSDEISEVEMTQEALSRQAPA